MRPPTLLDSGVAPPTVAQHLVLTPEQHISVYSDEQWEEFVLEWATSLDPRYEQLMRNGGANDHGVDIAGFLTDQRFDGPWDCYQCKHYRASLKVSDAYPEIMKVVLGALAGHYTWPRRYRFAAPKGYSTSLANLLHAPGNLKPDFVRELTKPRGPLARQLGEAPIEDVLRFVEDADFSVFGTVQLHELTGGHSQTRWHSVRFGVALPPRPMAPVPAPEPAEHEQRYVEKLLAVYRERHGDPDITSANAGTRPAVRDHYHRQRVAFYSAEALRVFARDSVPDGTFSALQEEIFDGVIDVHDLDHDSGFARLHEVSQAARSLSITSNGLLPVVAVRDRTGICHQLANDDRLDWCRADPQ
ncbi:hypothetical protein E1218_05060 [Kribbella turkmenica]|uniref:ABC-three component systems C-terminal domain-containing protein n=2 Tax=Kribbella turkmenica TaxID=2530375 RepID=A0A4R4XEI4_9ACTN|nr:hypothetical protein E1218_05060 [Kribbella turkmenica]